MDLWLLEIDKIDIRSAAVGHIPFPLEPVAAAAVDIAVADTYPVVAVGIHGHHYH